MKRALIFLIVPLAFLVTGIIVNAQNTKDVDPTNFELDEHPTFKGGTPNDFAYWVARHIKYPKDAKEIGVEGTVMVHFVIDTDGKIYEAHVHEGEGVHQLLDEEAVRVVKKSPKWKPGKKDGKPVKVSYTMPVVFGFR